MDLAQYLTAVLTTVSVAGILWVGATLVRMSGSLATILERTSSHGRRLDRIEAKLGLGPLKEDSLDARDATDPG